MISVYNEVQQQYLSWLFIDFGVEWIRNPERLNFEHEYHMHDSQRHSRWTNFLHNRNTLILTWFLLENKFSLDKWHGKGKSIHGIDFDILMKAIDKVELEFLPEIQKSNEKKEIFDRLKLGEIFELQRSKNLIEDDLSDPEMSWLSGTTLEEKLQHFIERKKNENFLELLGRVPKGIMLLSINLSCLIYDYIHALYL